MSNDKNKIVFPYPDKDFFDDGIPKGVLSPSGFGTYRRCPRQFEYSYVQGIISPPGISMVKGKAIHKGAEVVHQHTIDHQKPMPLEEATQRVSDYFDDEKKDVEDWEDTTAGDVKDNTLANFNAYYIAAVPLIRPVAVEKPFAQRIGTVPMRGVMDLIDTAPGEYSIGDDPEQPPPAVEVVSDLKTARAKWSEDKVNRHPQLTIYAIVEDTEFVRVDLLLDQKRGCKYSPLRALRDVNEKRVLVEDVEEVVYLIKKGFFPRCDPVLTSWVCTPRFCGYYARCRGPR